MSSTNLIDESLKTRWPELRSGVVSRLQKGEITSSEATRLLTESMDAFLLELIDFTADRLSGNICQEISGQLAVIAVGGYGRNEMFPYSDVDLLITYERTLDEDSNRFATELVRNCWDAKLKIGSAIRSIPQTVSLLREESQVASALVETRLIWGSEEVHQKLRTRFEGWLQKSKRAFIDACEESRKEEIKESASAVYSLEPDVKKSPGTMRDLQLIRWVGFAKYGVTGFRALGEQGALSPETVQSLEQAHLFLTNIRMQLHIHANRAQDLLTLQEQLRLTDQKGLTDLAGQRAVEQFMQQYYLKADFVSKTAKRFIELNRPSTFQERIASRVYRKVVEQKYLIVAGRLNAPGYEIAKIATSVEEILKTFLVAARHRVRVSSRLIEAIRKQLPELPRTVSQAEADLFLEILDQFGYLGETLRDLCECGVLEILIPQFTHSRGLLQFNHYHAYTVDEHTLRTLDALDALTEQTGELRDVISKLKQRNLLPLALLLHDLGKGFEQDHSVLGAEIAHKIGARFHLERDATKQVARLVREHLSMSLLAFRRDTSDPRIVAEFSRTVRDIDTLRKLYLLTICDIQAVAPGIWDDWKERLLHELFERTRLSLVGKYARPHLNQQLDEIRRQTLDIAIQNGLSEDKLELLTFELAQMPEHYLLSGSVESIARDLQIAISLEDDQVEIAHRYDTETGSLELTIITRQRGLERCFHRLAGVLTALHLSILSADICSSPTGLICDRFLVEDQDFAGEPSPERLQKIGKELKKAASRPVSFERLFKKHRRFQSTEDSEPISDQESHVSIDNTSSDTATIIDVFARDLPGLLFTLSKALYDLDLSVTLARITTHVDQVVDVFYVTSLEGKPLDEFTCKAIRDRLEHVLNEFERFGHRLFSS